MEVTGLKNALRGKSCLISRFLSFMVFHVIQFVSLLLQRLKICYLLFLRAAGGPSSGYGGGPGGPGGPAYGRDHYPPPPPPPAFFRDRMFRVSFKPYMSTYMSSNSQCTVSNKCYFRMEGFMMECMTAEPMRVTCMREGMPCLPVEGSALPCHQVSGVQGTLSLQHRCAAQPQSLTVGMMFSQDVLPLVQQQQLDTGKCPNFTATS